MWSRCYGRFARRSNPCQNAAHAFSPAARLFPTPRFDAQLRRGHRCSRRCVDRKGAVPTGHLEADPRPCVAVALFVSVFLYACVDRGRLFTYFGWTKPRRAVSWLYALLSGILAAVGVLSVVRVAHMSLGAASLERLLYGVTLGPILEEVFFRGAAFSVIYVTASSVKNLARLRITLAIIGSSLLFALAHTKTVGIPFLLFFGTGTLYAMMRWRSNSTAAAALMHATYNAVIVLAMLRA